MQPGCPIGAVVAAVSSCDEANTSAAAAVVTTDAAEVTGAITSLNNAKTLANKCDMYPASDWLMSQCTGSRPESMAYIHVRGVYMYCACGLIVCVIAVDDRSTHTKMELLITYPA